MIDISTVKDCIMAIRQVTDVLQRFTEIDKRYQNIVDRFHRASEHFKDLILIVEDIATLLDEGRIAYFNNQFRGLLLGLGDTQQHVDRWARRLSVESVPTDYDVPTTAVEGITRWPLLRTAVLLKKVVSGVCVEGSAFEESGESPNTYKKAANALNRVDFFLDGEQDLVKQVTDWEVFLDRLGAHVAACVGRINISGRTISLSRKTRIPIVSEVLARVEHCKELQTSGVIRPIEREALGMEEGLDREIQSGLMVELASRFWIPKVQDDALDPKKYILDFRLYATPSATDAAEPDVQRIAALFSDVPHVEDSAEEKAKSKKQPQPQPISFLKCVGYLKRSTFENVMELVFELPEWAHPEPLSLRVLLMNATEAGVGRPLDQRLRFTIQLLECLLLVHAMGLVHKDIRPENIFVFESSRSRRPPPEDGPYVPKTLGRPFLLGFSQTRSLGTPSKQGSLPGDRPRVMMYRHPSHLPQHHQDKRVRKYTQEDDRYSIGVCLIEIALWKSFSVWRFDHEEVEAGNLELHVNDEVLKYSSFAKSSPFDKWWRAKDRLIELAENEVRWAMGPIFSDIVLECLRSQDREYEEDDKTIPSLDWISDALDRLRSVRI